MAGARLGLGDPEAQQLGTEASGDQDIGSPIVICIRDHEGSWRFHDHLAWRRCVRAMEELQVPLRHHEQLVMRGMGQSVETQCPDRRLLS